MARKGKRNSYRKYDIAKLKKNAIVNAKPQPTEPSTDNSSKEQFTSARSSSVPTESSAGDVIIGFLQRWSHWIAWFGFVSAGIFAYSTFNNDISNTKSEVQELKAYSKENHHNIVSVEKSVLRNGINIEHLSSELAGAKNEIGQAKSEIKKLEIIQAKQSAISNRDNTLTKPSSGHSR